MHWELAIAAGALLAYAAVSGRLDGSPITAPMVFTSLGLLFGADALGLVEPSATGTAVKILAEATLAVVLFSDASRIDLRALRREVGIPARLLGIGLPLTIVAGFVAALVVLGELHWPEALVLAVILAPTDAALGQAVVTTERLPLRVRQSLNVESGLNDGICVPLFLIALAVAAGVIVVAGRRGLVASSWLQIVPLAGAGLAFGFAEAIGGSGFIAAFVGGGVFGWVRSERGGEVSYLIEQGGTLLAALTFGVFGAVLLGPAIGDLTWQIGLYAVLSLTLLRMLPVAISMLGTGARRPTVAFLGWFGPRGAASIVFALLMIEEGAGLPHEDLLLTTAFVTIGLSVFAHGVTAAPLATRYADWLDGHPPVGELDVESGAGTPGQRWRLAPKEGAA